MQGHNEMSANYLAKQALGELEDAIEQLTLVKSLLQSLNDSSFMTVDSYKTDEVEHAVHVHIKNLTYQATSLQNAIS